MRSLNLISVFSNQEFIPFLAFTAALVVILPLSTPFLASKLSLFRLLGVRLGIWLACMIVGIGAISAGAIVLENLRLCEASQPAACAQDVRVFLKKTKNLQASATAPKLKNGTPIQMSLQYSPELSKASQLNNPNIKTEANNGQLLIKIAPEILGINLLKTPSH